MLKICTKFFSDFAFSKSLYITIDICISKFCRDSYIKKFSFCCFTCMIRKNIHQLQKIDLPKLNNIFMIKTNCGRNF